MRIAISMQHRFISVWIGDKVWIKYDDTEEGVATDLVNAGIPKKNIVLGFRHPKIRQHTGFAVA